MHGNVTIDLTFKNYGQIDDCIWKFGNQTEKSKEHFYKELMALVTDHKVNDKLIRTKTPFSQIRRSAIPSPSRLTND